MISGAMFLGLLVNSEICMSYSVGCDEKKLKFGCSSDLTEFKSSSSLETIFGSNKTSVGTVGITSGSTFAKDYYCLSTVFAPSST